MVHRSCKFDVASYLCDTINDISHNISHKIWQKIYDDTNVESRFDNVDNTVLTDKIIVKVTIQKRNTLNFLIFSLIQTY